jgi:hypothetical protein
MPVLTAFPKACEGLPDPLAVTGFEEATCHGEMAHNVAMVNEKQRPHIVAICFLADA